MSNGPPTYRKTGKDLAVLKLPGNATAKFSNVFKPVFGIFFTTCQKHLYLYMN